MTTEEIRVNFSTNLDASGISEGAQSADKALGKLEKSFNGVEKQAQGFLGSFDNLTAGFGKFALLGGGVVAAISGIAIGIKKFNDRAIEGAEAVRRFEGAITSIKTSTQATESEVESLTELINILGAEANVESDEIARYVSQFTSLGLSQEQAIRATTAGINVANQEGKELKTTFDAILDTYKGSREQAVKMGIPVAEMTMLELQRGAAVASIEKTYGKTVKSSELVSENQRQSQMLAEAIDTKFSEIFKSSSGMRKIWGDLNILFKQGFLVVLDWTDQFIKWITQYLPTIINFIKGLISLLTRVGKFIFDLFVDIFEIAKSLLSFLGVDGLIAKGFELTTGRVLKGLKLLAEEIALEGAAVSFGGEIGGGGDPSEEDKRKAARDKKFEELLASLNKTNRQIFTGQSDTAKAAKDTAKSVKDPKPLTIGNILGDAKSVLSARAQFKELKGLIAGVLKGEDKELASRLSSLFEKGIDITPSTVVKLAEGDKKARKILADIFAAQIATNDYLQDEKDRNNEKDRKEKERRAGIVPASILGEADQLNQRLKNIKEFEEILERIGRGGLSAREAIRKSRDEEDFRKGLVRDLATYFRAEERREKREEREAEEQKRRDEQRRNIQESLLQIQEANNQNVIDTLDTFGAVIDGIDAVISSASQIKTEDEISQLKTPQQKAQAKLDNFEIGKKSAIEFAEGAAQAAGIAFGGAFGPQIGDLASKIVGLLGKLGDVTPEQVNAFFDNLIDGMVVWIDEVARNLEPIIATIVSRLPDISLAILDQLPKIVLSLLGAIKVLAIEWVKALIDYLPRLVTSLAGFLETVFVNAGVALYNGIVLLVNKIPGVDLEFEQFRQLPSTVRNQETVDRIAALEKIVKTPTPPDDETARTSEVRTETIISTAQTPQIEGAERTDDILTAAEAFNPYIDEANRRERQPVRIQIQIANTRLREILTDLDETGYNRVVSI